MTFDPTDFETAGPASNWLQLLLRGATSMRPRRRMMSVSELSPRLLDDIGFYAHPQARSRRRP
jgi:hypothetical protein